MGRGVFVAGLVLGILGFLWSVVMLLGFLVVTALTFGAGAQLLAIPLVGFAAAIVGIAGAALARGARARGGSALVLGAGVLLLLAAVVVPFALLDVGLLDTAVFSLVAGWWAYGLVLTGALGLRASSGGG